MKIVKSIYEKDSKMATKFYKSKTLILNGVYAVLGILETSGVINIIPVDYQGAAIAFIAFSNQILRLITKTPISK